MNLINELSENIFKRRVYSSFKENIWGADLVDIQLISKCNNGIRYLLYVINLFSKYAWVVPWKDRKGITILLLMHFKVFYTVQNANQAKYGLIKVLNFITTLSKMVKRESHRRGFNIQ